MEPIREIVRLLLREGGTSITIPSEWVDSIYSLGEIAFKSPGFLDQAEMSISYKNSSLLMPIAVPTGGIYRVQIQVDMSNPGLPVSVRDLFKSSSIREMEIFFYSSFYLNTSSTEDDDSFGLTMPARKKKVQRRGGGFLGNNPEIHIALLREDLRSMKGRSALKSIIQHELVHVLQYAAGGASWEDRPLRRPIDLWGMPKSYLGSPDDPAADVEEIEAIASEISKKIGIEITSLYRSFLRRYREILESSPEEAYAFFSDTKPRMDERNKLVDAYVLTLMTTLEDMSPEALDYIKRKILRDVSDITRKMEENLTTAVIDSLKRRISKIP